jgi:hypothetical protein
VKGLSIGFDTVKDAMDGTIRRLKEIRLWEGSIVTFPMNEKAQITSVKARRELKEDFDTEFAEIQLQDQMYQMWIALRNALCSIPWGDGTRDDKIAASQASIDQFASVYMEFIPAYIDWLTEEYGDMNYYGKTPAEQKAARERKAGRTLSDATRKTIGEAIDHQKKSNDILTTLCMEEADVDPDDTSASKAAVTRNPESAAIDHSAANKLIDEMRTLIPAA